MNLKLHLFPYVSIQTCVLGAQKNRLIETVLLSTNNMFWLTNRKINFQLEACPLPATKIASENVICRTCLLHVTWVKVKNFQNPELLKIRS